MSGVKQKTQLGFITTIPPLQDQTIADVILILKPDTVILITSVLLMAKKMHQFLVKRL
ncbi:hypothetical protein BKA69DRAFT_1108283 [Paraphysoderma sedebokerense]|nr:hypothetical protein BKA69DRAFT_1108283 [Paraphysoderma sedebokerense]